MSVLAKDLMQAAVLTVSPSTSLAEVERKFLSARVSGFPVVAGERLVGVVSRTDIVRKLVAEQAYADYVSDYYRGEGVEELAAGVAGLTETRVGARLAGATVEDVMAHELITVPPEATVAEVASRLVTHRVHRVLVTRDGALLGIITTLGLAALFADGRATVG